MSNYLNTNQVQELIYKNRYTFEGNKYKSRCFSSEYENLDSLPPLALPGGDIGELAVLLSASINYGFDLNLNTAWKILNKLVATDKNGKNQHSSSHNAEHCRYLSFLSENPESYGLNSESIKELFSTVEQSELLKNEQKMKGSYRKESALIIVEGEQGVFPHYMFESSDGKEDVYVLIYHKTRVDGRRKQYIEKLLSGGSVNLYEGLGEDYLYEILSETADEHLFETVKNIDLMLPIFTANIPEEGSIKVEQLS